MNTYTHYARPRCGKSLTEVLGETVSFCAHFGLHILRIDYGKACCKVVVQL
jgi:hypothetical protein